MFHRNHRYQGTSPDGEPFIEQSDPTEARQRVRRAQHGLAQADAVAQPEAAEATCRLGGTTRFVVAPL
jgi:hypothetical protein